MLCKWAHDWHMWVAICWAFFDFSRLKSEEKRLERKHFINCWPSERLPGHLSESSLELAINYKYLQENLTRKCVLHQSPKYKDILEDIFCVATTTYPWNKTDVTLSFTGIPLHIIQLAALCTLELKFDAVKVSAMKEIVSAMEKRRFASSEWITNKTIETTDGLEKVIENVTTFEAASFLMMKTTPPTVSLMCTMRNNLSTWEGMVDWKTFWGGQAKQFKTRLKNAWQVHH